MKRELILIIGVVLGIFLIANVTASVYFSQLESVYNIGDMIEMNVNVTPSDAGPLKIVLVCDNSSLDVYKGAPTDLIQLPLTTLWMNGLTGTCNFIGYYGGETSQSTSFKISKQLSLDLYATSFFAKPGDTITISGNVKRLNGDNVNGDVEITIPLIAGTNGSKEKLYGAVNNGEFSVDYNVKSDSSAGDYRVDVIAYEKTANERTSEGYEMANLQISQIAKSIDIALDSQNIDPGKTINFKTILYDQSDSPIDGDVGVKIIDSKSNSVFEKIVKSGDSIEYESPSNLSAGYYEIDASTESLSKIKSFHVNEKALVSFEIVNDTLIVKNIGNIPYNKSIEININGISFIKKIDGLNPGEIKEYKLNGDQGLNSVKVTDGETNLSQENVPLPVQKQSGVTGAAISVSGLASTPIVWIIVLVILALIILFLFRDIFKKKSVAYPAPEKRQTNFNNDSSVQVIKLDKKGNEIKNEPIERISSAAYTKRQMEERGIGEKDLTPISRKPSSSFASSPYRNQRTQNINNDTKVQVAPTPKKEIPNLPTVSMIGAAKPSVPSQAEQGLVTDGTRNRAAIIVIKVKNTINKFSKENLEKSIAHVYDKKGAVQEHGNFIFVIYSPVITKSYRNEIDATKDAEKIAEGLKEYNRKFSDKIDFGIGINSGDIISKIENKKLKFTSLGTLTIAAKKLSELSSGEVLMTKEAYEKAMSEVKTEKKTINGTEVYEVKKVADYDKNRKFIDGFLKRQNDIKNSSMIPKHSVSPRPAPNFEVKPAYGNSGQDNNSSNDVNKIFD